MCLVCIILFYGEAIISNDDYILVPNDMTSNKWIYES